jgi:hypothetical protein
MSDSFVIRGIYSTPAGSSVKRDQLDALVLMVMTGVGRLEPKLNTDLDRKFPSQSPPKRNWT